MSDTPITPASATSIEQEVADHLDDFYRRQVKRAADRLREVADRMEHEGLNVRPVVSGSCGPHTYAAHSAIHAAMWGMANASLDGLVTAAGEADAALVALAATSEA